jgi:hypothetical protein
MSIRTPSRSIFRPRQGIDQAVLDDHKKLIATIDRRKLLKGTISLGALTILTGCSVTDQGAVQAALQTVSGFNDKIQSLIFRPDHLVPTYTEAEVVKPPRFNAFYDIEGVKPVDVDGWKLELQGSIKETDA